MSNNPTEPGVYFRWQAGSTSYVNDDPSYFKATGWYNTADFDLTESEGIRIALLAKSTELRLQFLTIPEPSVKEDPQTKLLLSMWRISW